MKNYKILLAALPFLLSAIMFALNNQKNSYKPQNLIKNLIENNAIDEKQDSKTNKMSKSANSIKIKKKSLKKSMANISDPGSNGYGGYDGTSCKKPLTLFNNKC